MANRTGVVRKRFGQHFLHDQAVVKRIVDAFNPKSDQSIVEIGPGQGVLTRELIARTEQTIDVVEIDRDLIEHLQADRLLASRINIHSSDALKFDFNTLMPASGDGLRVIGNLPYMITTPLLFHLIASDAKFNDMLFMLQKEVVDRIVAKPGTREYGRLSIMLSPWFDCEHVFDVGAGAFKPPPKVKSAIVSMRPRQAGPLDLGDAGLYAEIVRRAFSARRKTLRNGLRGLVDAEFLKSIDIDPGLRPEMLTDQDFASIARQLKSQSLPD